MTGDTKNGDLAVGNRKHGFDIEITCKRFKNWVANQRLSTVKEACLATRELFGSSFMLALVCETLINDLWIGHFYYSPSSHPHLYTGFGGYTPLLQTSITKGLSGKTKLFTIMKGCDKTISYVMKNITGKEDNVHTSMVAGFGYGVAISLVSGMRGPAEIMSVGVVCALMNGGLFKIGLKI